MESAFAQPVWERVRAEDEAERNEFESSLEPLRSCGLTLFHEPAWLIDAEGRQADDVRLYRYRQGSEVIGYAAFVVQPWKLRFRLGEASLASWACERWHMNAGPVMMPGRQLDDADAFAALLLRVRGELTRRQVVYLEGTVVGSAVDRAIQDGAVSSAYRAFEPLPRYARSIARLPATFDAYLKAMKSQTRQNLRNAQRKLDRHAPTRLVCYRDAATVPDFVARAVAISRKTYQWRLLGLGLRDPDRLQRTLTTMTERGYTRCYLLECGGIASAFMIGYLHRGTYYYVDVGFDPDWERWSVGTVLHMEVIKDLIDDRVATFDFSTGTGVHKKRFGNEERDETAYVLMPATFSSQALIAAYRAMNGMSGGLVATLDRLHLKARIKRLVRRHAAVTATPDD